MMRLTCDLCDRILLLEEDVRYIVNIEVYAAYDPMELTDADLQRDHKAELRQLVERMKDMDPEKAQDSVYRKFTFHLCPRCQREFLKDPLARKTRKTDSD